MGSQHLDDGISNWNEPHGASNPAALRSGKLQKLWGHLMEVQLPLPTEASPLQLAELPACTSHRAQGTAEPWPGPSNLFPGQGYGEGLRP